MVRLHVSASVALCAKATPQKKNRKSYRQLPESLLALFDPPREDTFFLEHNLRQRGYSVVAGLDEVGRGPLAGPVVAAAVVLPINCKHSLFIDSKKLTAKKREIIFDYLHEIPAQIGVGIVSHKIIDKINILQASLLAMRRGLSELSKLHTPPDFLLVDGKFPVPIKTLQHPLIKGET